MFFTLLVLRVVINAVALAASLFFLRYDFKFLGLLAIAAITILVSSVVALFIGGMLGGIFGLLMELWLLKKWTTVGGIRDAIFVAV